MVVLALAIIQTRVVPVQLEQFIGGALLPGELFINILTIVASFNRC